MNQSHKRSFIAVLIFIGFLLFMAFWGIDLILGAYAGHKLSNLPKGIILTYAMIRSG